MKNVMKTATLESKFPLLAVENGCIISKDADITVAYRTPKIESVHGCNFWGMVGMNGIDQSTDFLFLPARAWGSLAIILIVVFIAVYPAGSHVLTSDGEEAIVVSQNKDFQDRPHLRAPSPRSASHSCAPCRNAGFALDLHCINESFHNVIC